ncbi:DUF924 family protein [Vibrio sinaloensis]|uniref:DUF924 family protein n=1 Tax=Photobacterium sp. (strain ATCC 43367) TaxID=379097 RepID=UPI0020697643|nr:DUF924 family protein [Vibrio sinaloensis]UPQ90167.1 DUF924 domain-containing protein [Vibrio sinaloensis]
MTEHTQPDDVIQFWFHELEPKDWFSSSLELDQRITSRFLPLLERAAQCELAHWRDSAQGRLAEIIVLDQFSRNIYRNTPRAFSQDPLALALAQEAVSLGVDQKLPIEQRSFLYMPYMHSESALIHTQALVLFNTPGLEHNYEFELKHKAIIDQFGRYPHRNKILGRESSEQELAFLEQPDSSF